MRKILLLIIPAFLIAAVQCKQPPKEIMAGKWKLVWEDDFKGKSIDDSKWSKIPRGKDNWNRYMSDYDGLYDIKDGALVIRGIKNESLDSDTASFLTGGIYTKDKKTFGLGRLEIKAKFGSATGAWQSLWMLPKEGKWPVGGEIDIMERANHDRYFYQTVQSEYTQTAGIKDNPPASTIIGMKTDKYNVYAVEKYTDSLVFYVNDTKTKVYPRIETEHKGQFPFSDQEFYLLIDMKLGGSNVGNINIEHLPAEMMIDWVRFYELNENSNLTNEN